MNSKNVATSGKGVNPDKSKTPTFPQTAYDAPRPWVIAVSPNRCCWHCERPLPAAPSAVVAELHPGDCAFDIVCLLCSADCERHVCDEMVLEGVEPETLSPGATSSRLRGADIKALVEGWLDGDIRWQQIHEGTKVRQSVRSGGH